MVPARGLVAHRVAAIGLRELADQVQTSGDEEWEAVRRQLDEIESYAPAIPPGLQTRLRDYQREGFYWLARLAPSQRWVPALPMIWGLAKPCRPWH